MSSVALLEAEILRCGPSKPFEVKNWNFADDENTALEITLPKMPKITLK